MKLSFKLICALIFFYGSSASCMTPQESKITSVRNARTNKYEVKADEVKTSDGQLSVSTEQARKNSLLSQLIVYDKETLHQLLYDLLTTLPKELIGMIVSYYHLHIPEGKLEKTFSIGTENVEHVTALSDDMLAVVTDKNDLHIWDCNAGTCVKTYGSETFKWFGEIKNVAEAKDGVIVLACEQQLGFLNVQENKITWYKFPFGEKCPDGDLGPASMSPKGWLVAASRYNEEYKDDPPQVALFDVSAMKWNKLLTHKLSRGSKLIFFTPENFATRSYSEGINFYDVKTGAQKGHAQHSPKGSSSWELRLSDNLLVVADWDEKGIKVWDVQTGVLIQSIENSNYRYLMVHPSNLLVADGFRGDPVQLFNPVTGKKVREFKIDGDHLTVLSSGRLATMSGSELKIWR